MAEDDRGQFLARSLSYLQENIRRSGPAAAAGYTLIGAILLLGGGGYALDSWRGTSPWFLLAGLLLGIVVGFYELAKDGLASMKPATWMIGGSVVSALAATAVTGPAMVWEVLAGMVGPLLVAVATWEMADQTFRYAPERLTARMVTAFAAKMVFFGAYVAVMLLALSLRPIPFVVSFTAYFIALHLAEALCLRRLFATGSRHV